jgi:hypothetical protein
MRRSFPGQGLILPGQDLSHAMQYHPAPEIAVTSLGVRILYVEKPVDA